MAYDKKARRKYYEINKERILAHNKAWRDRNPDKVKKYFKDLGKTPRRRKYDRDRCQIRNAKVKWDVLLHYGNGLPACVLCGHSKITSLSIDHIDGDGKKHRESLGKNYHMTGMAFYWWLKRNNYPEGFRVLCMNCQFDERARLLAEKLHKKE